MKKIFWFGLVGLLLFEIANVYFIMPMPGSQQMSSIDAAYFLYKWRWVFRVAFGLMIIVGLLRGRWHRKWKWGLVVPIGILAVVIYMANFQMAADAMFRQPKSLVMATASGNSVEANRLVIGISVNGEAKAYPIRFLGYHHHVQDTVGGRTILVTYCTVCRTGRVFEPLVNGKKESFRLVGMDHFNAMLEDETTGSWWQQATGKAITGKLKGLQLPEVHSTQTSLAQWMKLYPQSKVMQADPAFIDAYDSTLKFESGESRRKLTGTDSLSWKDKSWVLGIKSGVQSRAYDWNRLKKERVINDQLNAKQLAIILAPDDKSFFAFELPEPGGSVSLKSDTVVFNNKHFRLDGRGLDTSFSLKPVQASQEFWHSWRTFNPGTSKY